MKLPDSDFNDASLSRFGEEMANLLKKKDFQRLANRFGYALAFDRDEAKAIEEDLGRCIRRKHNRTSHCQSQQPSITVKYFETNATNLLAVVECIVEVDNDWVLVELIATQNGKDKSLCLEDINNVA